MIRVAPITVVEQDRPPPPCPIQSPLLSAVVLIVALTLPSTGYGDQLLYIEAADCAACQQFNVEVAPHYGRSGLGSGLPMIRIALEEWHAGTHPAGTCVSTPVHGTPTFIYLKACEELDRISGYSSAELFWMALERMRNAASDHEAS